MVNNKSLTMLISPFSQDDDPAIGDKAYCFLEGRSLLWDIEGISFLRERSEAKRD